MKIPAVAIIMACVVPLTACAASSKSSVPAQTDQVASDAGTSTSSRAPARTVTVTMTPTPTKPRMEVVKPSIRRDKPYFRECLDKISEIGVAKLNKRPLPATPDCVTEEAMWSHNGLMLSMGTLAIMEHGRVPGKVGYSLDLMLSDGFQLRMEVAKFDGKFRIISIDPRPADGPWKEMGGENQLQD